jgi:8-oxo-dGTP diphosphatase
MSKDKIHVTTRAAVIDQGHLLVCKTTDLEQNFYFMPGGHIEHNETAEHALLRELEEETGSKGKIKRLLGVLEYIFEPGHSSICHNHEYSFYFEAELDDIKFDTVLPKIESNVDLMWIKLENLKTLDFRPEPLMELLPKWLEREIDNAFYSKVLEK